MSPVNRGRLSDDVVGRDLFQFDSEGLATECPMGHSPIDHRMLSHNNTTSSSLHAIFDGDTCRSCTMLDQCPVRAPNHRNRGCGARDTVGDFRLEITPENRLRDHMYFIQKTTEWKDRYKIRSGIEATNSELKRSHGIGKREKQNKDDAIPCILEPVEDPDFSGKGSSKEFRKNWARLIQKIYEVDPLTCPKCSGTMKVISVIENEDVIKKILKHLGLWDVKVYPPSFGRARPPPKSEKSSRVMEPFMDYKDSQLPPSYDYLYHDIEYPEALSS